MFRRDFLKLAGLAPLALAFPERLAAALSVSPAARAQLGGRVLVLVELKGGNDGLNTVIPYADPLYAKLRPNLGIAREKVVQLDDALGLHPALAPLLPLWKSGGLGLALGVGYPRPNRSHFRSIEIWETASDSDEFKQEGWVGQCLPTEARAGLVADGLVLGNGDIGPLAGAGLRTIALNDPQQFLKQARALPTGAAAARNPALAHILGVQQETQLAAHEIETQTVKMPQFKGEFPKHRFGQQMQTAARLIAAGVPVAAIKVSQGSFDTHSNQGPQHERLLGELAGGLVAFEAAMRESGHWDRVLVLSYSEFGRRAAQNGSRGTDHGTAAPHFMLGGRVKGGLYGAQPALGALENQDLVHTLDYRDLYATVAQGWWGLQLGSASALAGHKALPCLA